MSQSAALATLDEVLAYLQAKRKEANLTFQIAESEERIFVYTYAQGKEAALIDAIHYVESTIATVKGGA